MLGFVAIMMISMGFVLFPRRAGVVQCQVALAPYRVCDGVTVLVFHINVESHIR